MSAKGMNSVALSRYRGIINALIVSNSIGVLLLIARFGESQTNRYWFLLWNLVLAWLPLLFAYLLTRRLQKSFWLTWQNVLLTILWFGFLPNSFYLVSDFIHLHETGEVSLLYDVVLFFIFVFNAFTAGFISVYLIHKEMLQRLERGVAHMLAAAVLFACSFAIYLGRTLRWNTWDIIVNPAGILFDVSDRIISPTTHPQALVTTTTFFMLLVSMYYVIWELVELLKSKKS